MRVHRLVVAAGLAVALGACGRDGAVTVDSGSPPASVEDDRAAASRVVLTAGDVPGFSAGTPVTPDATTLTAASGFESCAGAPALLSAGDRMALSPAYFRGHVSAVSSLAMVAPGEGQARQAMADLGRPDMGGCITGLFRSMLALDQVPGTTAVTELGAIGDDIDDDIGDNIGDEIGDEILTWHTTIKVVTPQPGTAYASLTFFRTGRAVGSLFDFQLGTPFPASDRARLLATLVERTRGI